MGLQLSILFIPFDAAIQHFNRNAAKGVTGYSVATDTSGKRKRTSDHDYSVESAGTPFELRASKKQKLTGQASRQNQQNLQALLVKIIQSCCDQINDNRSQNPYYPADIINRGMQSAFDRVMSRRESLAYPNVIFLSEEPGELSFPDNISLWTRKGVNLIYSKLGSAGQKAVQRIFAYVRSDLLGPNDLNPFMPDNSKRWMTAAVIKKTAPFNKEENLLVVKYTLEGISCCFAGVHLSSKNTGASNAQEKTIVTELESFCNSQSVPIQFVIGDLNMDIHSGPFTGNVGARSGTTVYQSPGGLPNSTNTHGVSYQEQWSNSTNSEHYMGHYVVDKTRIGLFGSVGLSLNRSLNSQYFSDHPPIYAELEFFKSSSDL